MSEMILNGALEEEVTKYYHICFYTDAEGPDTDNPDNYIFVPKVVCRVVDEMTVSVLEWYVKEKKLLKYVRGARRKKVYTRSNMNQSKPSFNKPIGYVKR